MKLSDLKVGEKSTVWRFDDKQIGGKLMTMGMVPGSQIELIRKMSAGKTFYIKVNGYGMALRIGEAAKIMLKTSNEVVQKVCSEPKVKA